MVKAHLLPLTFHVLVMTKYVLLNYSISIKLKGLIVLLHFEMGQVQKFRAGFVSNLQPMVMTLQVSKPLDMKL
ncbi:unnamed protein product [Oppiella nova]|uniref:Uncharacterized protein n=1 Tax=Oppiella nova TaxID=334625 RepID=A0A7R9L9J6_9ACAR|nr:unnamed protein product [Oppiella nova]CAG2160057.1 unnamed protein product [Oppiella nova]